MLETPVTSIKKRSNPRPNPLCGAEPIRLYFLYLCLKLIERGFIRYFLSEGHDLVNKQGTCLRRHEFISSGKLPKRFFPRLMYVDRTKGE